MAQCAALLPRAWHAVRPDVAGGCMVRPGTVFAGPQVAAGGPMVSSDHSVLRLEQSHFGLSVRTQRAIDVCCRPAEPVGAGRRADGIGGSVVWTADRHKSFGPRASRSPDRNSRGLVVDWH